jgi:hypothetical protein
MKPFFIEIRMFGLGQTNWGIFAQTILSAPILVHTVNPLSMFFINQPLFQQKHIAFKPFYRNIYLGLRYAFGLQRIRALTHP